MDEYQILNALSEYGATLTTDGFISRNGKVTGIKIITDKKRLRFESANGQLFATGPQTEKTIRQFVERFWFWNKTG